MLRFLDATLGRWIRHFFFVVLRSYYALTTNVSISGKGLLQEQPGTLIIATHVSRHDGPFVASMLYSTTRVRPTVHYKEYNHWAQWFVLWVSGCIPMSSPAHWPAAKRATQKETSLGIIHKVLDKGRSVLIFPAGRIRQQPDEIVKPQLSGVHDILSARPDTPVMLLRLGGIGRFQEKQYDKFWSFIGRRQGRLHVSLDLTPITLDTSLPLDQFNAHLERLLNAPVDYAGTLQPDTQGAAPKAP